MDQMYFASRPPKNPFLFAIFVSRNLKVVAFTAIAAVIIGESLDMSLAVILKMMIDAAVNTAENGFSDTTLMWTWAILYPVVYYIDESTWRVSGFSGMRWITGARAQASSCLFAYMTDHSTTYFNERFAGSLTNKIGNAARGTNDILSSFLWEFLRLFIKFGLSLVIISVANWKLGAMLGFWIALFLMTNAWLVWKKHPFAYAVAETSSVLKGKMVDSTSNITAVHQHGHHEFEREYVNRYIDANRNADIKNWWLSEWILIFDGTLIALFIAGMFTISLSLFSAGVITIGTVVMIASIVLDIVQNLFFIGHKMTDLMDTYGQTQEGLEEILVSHEIVDASGAEPLNVIEGRITFQHLEFGFTEQAVFRNLSLDIVAGQKVGLVGMSGAGKTTLINLLLRQFEIEGGAILIDNQDIRHVTRESFRKQIAVVAQDVSLFHRTIRENIRYGRLDASDADVEQAAKLAQAHEFIVSLPKRYDTLVGERGVRLSGGQRQRVAVARAILKDAAILVLDEATSSLDSESESAIQSAFTELMKGKTVIAIAHRLSTLQMMDRIVVLDSGAIVEDGTHEELLVKKGIYARLWSSQVSGFIQE